MAKPMRVLVPRHGPVVRITHWINVLAVSLLLMSGLQIFNAHPALYWGHKSTFATPWLSMNMVETTAGPRGVSATSSLVMASHGSAKVDFSPQ